MYFLSEEERRLILRRYSPLAREVPVSEEMRGWNWPAPPLSPVYRAPLGVSEVASRHCPTGRDVYLRHVLGEQSEASAAMVDGAYYHEIVADVILRAKQMIYRDGSGCLPALEQLADDDPPCGRNCASPAARSNGDLLWHYEVRRICTRAADVLARMPHAGADALAATILPVTVEQPLDGSFLGLGRSVRVDALHFGEAMVAGLKFGRKQRFHRTALAGYALVLESLLEQPINLGYLAYVGFEDGHVTVEREFHVLGDELRQWFTEERDEKARMVELELDPGLAHDCPRTCPYWSVCYPE